MRRRVCHPLCAAGRTHAAILTGKRHKYLVATRGTADAGEDVAEDAAPQIAIELGDDEGGEVTAGIAIGSFGQECGQVLTNGAVQQRLFGLTPLVTKRRAG